MRTALLTIVLAALLISAKAATNTTQITLQWSYSDPAPNAFTVYWTTNAVLPVTNWAVISLPGTNALYTNSVTLTNYSMQVIPGQYFFTMSASDFWGESFFDGTVSTPQVRFGTKLSVKRP